MLFKGEQFKLAKAKALKLVARKSCRRPRSDRRRAKDWIKGGGKAVAPWDEKGFKLPGGPGLLAGRHDDVSRPANAIYRRETYDNYPAARAILSASMKACSCRWTRRCASSRATSRRSCARKEAAAMIRSLFLSMQELNKGARRPQDVPPTKVKKLGVIGAGFMGAGVGYVSAQAGIEVVLIDRDQESADKGKAPCRRADRRPDRQGPRQGRPTATRCWRASPRPPTMTR